MQRNPCVIPAKAGDPGPQHVRPSLDARFRGHDTNVSFHELPIARDVALRIDGHDYFAGYRPAFDATPVVDRVMAGRRHGYVGGVGIVATKGGSPDEAPPSVRLPQLRMAPTQQARSCEPTQRTTAASRTCATPIPNTRRHSAPARRERRARKGGPRRPGNRRRRRAQNRQILSTRKRSGWRKSSQRLWASRGISWRLMATVVTEREFKGERRRTFNSHTRTRAGFLSLAVGVISESDPSIGRLHPFHNYGKIAFCIGRQRSQRLGRRSCHSINARAILKADRQRTHQNAHTATA